MKLTRTDANLIRGALYDAIGWQRGLIDAYSHMKDDPAYADAVKTVKAYKALLRKHFGDDRTPEDHLREITRMEPVSIFAAVTPLKITPAMIEALRRARDHGSAAAARGVQGRTGGAIHRMCERMVIAGLLTPAPFKLTAKGRHILEEHGK